MAIRLVTAKPTRMIFRPRLGNPNYFEPAGALINLVEHRSEVRPQLVFPRHDLKMTSDR
jgi:hypothetical protein